MPPAGRRARESAPDARRTRLCEHAAVGKPASKQCQHGWHGWAMHGWTWAWTWKDMDMAMDMAMDRRISCGWSRVAVGMAMRQRYSRYTQIQQIQQIQQLQQIQQIQQRYNRDITAIQQIQQKYSDPSAHASVREIQCQIQQRYSARYSAIQQIQSIAGALCCLCCRCCRCCAD
eukprot:3829434-Prymnesium_polylepis.1